MGPRSTMLQPTTSTFVMVIRHGEKPSGATGGVDQTGQRNRSSMTVAGWERARNLVGILDPAGSVPSRPGLARPAAIYAAAANDNGVGLRTRETVAPLAAKLDVPVNTQFGKGQERALVEQATTQPGPTLICWQHGEIPTIAHAFPAVAPAPPASWPKDRFDVIWTFTRTASGWRFAQVPELALPGDSGTVIR